MSEKKHLDRLKDALRRSNSVDRNQPGVRHPSGGRHPSVRHTSVHRSSSAGRPHTAVSPEARTVNQPLGDRNSEVASSSSSLQEEALGAGHCQTCHQCTGMLVAAYATRTDPDDPAWHNANWEKKCVVRRFVHQCVPNLNSLSPFDDGAKVETLIGITSATPFPGRPATVDVSGIYFGNRRTTYIKGFAHKTGDFVVSVDENSLMADVCLQRPQLPTFDCPDAYSQARAWIKDCTDNHPGCSKMTDKLLPTRLVDVGSAQNEPYLFIPPRGAKGTYVALSYCWGSTPQYTLISNDLTRGLLTFPMAALSKTIQDAITICRKLGFRYIWIDALCIVQDFSRGTDRIAESSMMDLIYGNAALTISASAANDSSKGILNKPTPPSSGTCTIPFLAQRPGDYKVFSLGDAQIQFYPHNLDASEPISSRAWALQEYLLSPRILSYQTHQMAWECDSQKLYSSGPFSSKLSRRRKLWEDFVMEFTRRDLSVLDDRLIALSGYVKMRFESMRRAALKKMDTSSDLSIGEMYLAGLWKPYLAEHMLWYNPESRPRTRPRTYRAPTWSWGSVDGPVEYVKVEEMGLRHGILEHLETSLATSTLNPFGSINASPTSYLLVRGYLKKAEGMEAPSLLSGLPNQREFLSSTAKSWLIHFDILDVFNQYEEDTELWCLNVTEHTALILKRVVKYDMFGKPNIFERIGLVRHSAKEQWDWFDDVEKAEVYLV